MKLALDAGKFPLLIKFLDANRWLSVQVHPDDAYGLAHGGDWGKTEMWVFLYAEPGAEIIYGFKAGVTPRKVCPGGRRRQNHGFALSSTRQTGRCRLCAQRIGPCAGSRHADR